MLRIAICDDNIPITSEIEHLLLLISNKHGIQIDIDIFFDGLSLYNKIQSGLIFDLIYIDIEMEKLDGIETAHLIRNLQLPTLLIYISAYQTYFKQLFEVEPFRFISKPIDKQLFNQYFYAAYKKLNKQKLFFTFNFNQIANKVPISDIIFIESKGRYIILHTIHHQYRFIEKLNNIEPFFLSNDLNFLRIHQSYIINPYYIRSICLAKVTMYNNYTLSISNKYQESVRQKYLLMIEDL